MQQLCSLLFFKCMQFWLLCASYMQAKPVGLQALFSLINMTSPNNTQLKQIFATLLNFEVVGFDDAMKPLGDQISQGSIEVYRAVAKEMLLSTPAKSHYLFNTRNLDKITQGVMQATQTFYDNQVFLSDASPCILHIHAFPNHGHSSGFFILSVQDLIESCDSGPHAVQTAWPYDTWLLLLAGCHFAAVVP